MTPKEFRQRYPRLFYLDPNDLAGVRDYLRSKDLLGPDETVRETAKAGEGNMNCTARVITSHRALILKQARPWVEKYPQFAAPWDRACREMDFHELAERLPAVARRLPKLLLGDREARVLVMEDLGQGGDYADIYQGQAMPDEAVADLASFLSDLHAGYAEAEPRPTLPNREMRALNHAHIFVIPLEPNNGLALDSIMPGLGAAAAALKSDAEYRRTVARLGEECYLADGPCLLHGDFFPGGFVRTRQGPKVIDAEFCFFGRPEFDAGVFLAHLCLGLQPMRLRRVWRQNYRPIPGFDEDLMLQLTGVEIMRRLIGYAQLPLRVSLASVQWLLEFSRRLVLSPRAELMTHSC